MNTTAPRDVPLGKYLWGLGASTVTLLTGGWLILAPFALGYQPYGATWADQARNDIWTGVAVSAASLAGLALFARALVGELRAAGVLAARRRGAPAPRFAPSGAPVGAIPASAPGAAPAYIAPGAEAPPPSSRPLQPAQPPPGELDRAMSALAAALAAEMAARRAPPPAPPAPDALPADATPSADLRAGTPATGENAGRIPAMPSLSEMLATTAPVTRPGPSRDNRHTPPPQRSTALPAPDPEPDGAPPANPPYVPYAPYRPYLPYLHYSTAAHPTPRLPLRPLPEADR